MLEPTTLALAELSKVGILLIQDKRLPNLVTLVTGEPVSGSWWSHAQAHLIYDVLGEVCENPDVLLTKLLFSKDTLIHRSLWSAFLSVVTTGESWQLDGLTVDAKLLLEQVNASTLPFRASGSATRELLSRLLVYATEVHTEIGKHAKELEPWSVWAARVGVIADGSVKKARAEIEHTCIGIGAPLKALPWNSSGSVPVVSNRRS